MSLDTNVEGIGHLISDRLLAIPDYQRSYSWGDDELNDLWRDLEAAVAADVTEYFLGSIVTTQSADGRLQVIDGQQRLATATLIYGALRDLFAVRSDERAAEMERDLLGKRDMLTRVVEQRLKLNAEDNDLFRQLTLEGPNSRALNPTTESHERLINAFNFFKTNFETLIEGRSADDWQEPLLEWYSFVFDKARVIEVSVPDESRAFVIFETLNDRGLNLSTADLLKNHLFGMAGDRLEEVKARWNAAMASVSSVGDLDNDTFLRHFWASKRGVVRVKALYSQIKPTISDPDTAVAFADELSEAAPLWAAMFDRDADLWQNYPAGSLDALDALRNLKVEQCRPLLLSVLRKFSRDQIKQTLALVLAWSVRWSVVGGGGAGTVERLYAQAAMQVSDGTISSVADLSSFFDPHAPSDLAFKDAFATARISRGWVARYYLSVLEREKNGDPEPELVPNQDVEEVNLEHVLPKSPDSQWSGDFSPEEAKSMVLLLGNQALLRKSHNGKIGNQGFDVKKPVLAASDLSLTKEIGQEDQWTAEEIRARSQRLADLAPSVWSKA